MAPPGAVEAAAGEEEKGADRCSGQGVGTRRRGKRS